MAPGIEAAISEIKVGVARFVTEMGEGGYEFAAVAVAVSGAL